MGQPSKSGEAKGPVESNKLKNEKGPNTELKVKKRDKKTPRGPTKRNPQKKNLSSKEPYHRTNPSGG